MIDGMPPTSMDNISVAFSEVLNAANVSEPITATHALLGLSILGIATRRKAA